MNYALVFRPEVREELNEAYSWYEGQQKGLGDEFLDCVDEMLNRICQMPESYPVVYHDVRRAVVQRFPYYVFLVEIAILVNVQVKLLDDFSILDALFSLKIQSPQLN